MHLFCDTLHAFINPTLCNKSRFAIIFFSTVTKAGVLRMSYDSKVILRSRGKMVLTVAVRGV